MSKRLRTARNATPWGGKPLPEPIPAGTKAKRKPPRIDENALALALEHHIIDFKKGARGRITQVKHIKRGWMTIEAYYDWCKGHDFLYIAGPQIIQGGYRINGVIYGLEVDVAGFSIPVGPGIVIATVGAIVAAANAGDLKTATLLTAALVLPFGSILLLYMWARWFGELPSAAFGAPADPNHPVPKDPLLGWFIDLFPKQATPPQAPA